MATRLPTSADGRVVTVATNRKARRDFEILDTVEAGIVLKGSEVKSLRDAKVQLADAFARVSRSGEMWLENAHISEYGFASRTTGHTPVRSRKLLLHRAQIDKWAARMQQERLTVVPLDIHFTDGRAKVELGLARGKRSFDKRETIKRREADREAERAMRRRGR